MLEWKIEIGGLLAAAGNLQVGDARTPQRFGSTGVQGGADLGGDALKFAIQASASATVEVFNDAADVDALGVFGAQGAAEDGAFRPVLVPAQKSWIKYAAAVKARVAANVPLPYVGVSASAEASLLLADYRAHEPTEKLDQALQRDVAGLRAAVVPAHVLALANGDALAFQAAFRLQAGVEVSWSGMLAANLHAIASALAPGMPIQAKLSAGATFGADVAVEDEFLVVFARTSNGVLEAHVRKAAQRRLGVAASIGVTLAVADASTIAGYVASVLDAIVGTSVAALEQLLDSFATATLNDVQKNVLLLLLDRLGLGDLSQSAQQLKAAWDAKKKDVEARVVTLLTKTVEASFTYDYARTESTSTLASFTLTPDLLAKMHGDLIVGKVGAAIAKAPQALQSFFGRRTTLTERSFGFSLGLGGVSLLGSKDGKTLRSVVDQLAPGDAAPRRVSFLGARYYKGQLFSGAGEWSSELRADMRDYRVDPTAEAFRFGFSFFLKRSGADAAGARLSQAIDEAIVWRIIDDGDDRLVQSEIEKFAAGRAIETLVTLTAGDEVVQKVLPYWATAPLAAWSRPLGRALPWFGGPSRSNPDFRQILYEAMWNQFLTDKGQGWVGDKVRLNAAYYVSQSSVAKNDAPIEKLGQAQGTVADVLNLHPSLYAACKSFQDGLVLLYDSVYNNRNRSQIQSAFQAFEPYWGTSYYTKVFGAALLAASASHGLERSIERTLQVRVLDGSGDSLLFSSSARS